MPVVQNWVLRWVLGCVNSLPRPEEAWRLDSRNLGPTLYPICVPYRRSLLQFHSVLLYQLCSYYQRVSFLPLLSPPPFRRTHKHRISHHLRFKRARAPSTTWVSFSEFKASRLSFSVSWGDLVFPMLLHFFQNLSSHPKLFRSRIFQKGRNGAIDKEEWCNTESTF